MRKLNIRLPIALVVISACLAIAPAAFAGTPGTIEQTPATSGTVYLTSAPTFDWVTYGALNTPSTTCEVIRTAPSASTRWASADCTAGAANGPTVNGADAPSATYYHWNMTPLVTGDGAYRLTYNAAFSSLPSASLIQNFVIDTINPAVTAGAPTGVTTDNTPSVSYSAEDTNLDRTICAVDPVDPENESSYTPCPASPYSLPPLADGDHTFYVVAFDKVGHLDVAVKGFNVDATGPVITITGLKNGEVLSTAWPPLSVGASDPGTGVQSTTCAYDANAPTQCGDESFLNAPLPDGPHTLSVVARDFGGNVSSRVISFTVDTSGGLTQGFAAPKTAKFKVKRGKLKAGKYPITLNVTFALPAGAPKTACSGSAKINVIVKKKQVGSASAKFKLTSGKCVATGKPKIPKKFKNKKAKIGFAYKSGPIKAFTLYGTGKL